jgi:DNA-binding NarL/FixJ family response regulator
MPIRVFHVDDHEAFSEQLRSILEPHVEWAGASSGADDVVAEVVATEPEVVLLDISIPGKSGLDLAREMRDLLPTVRIVFVTMHADPVYVDAALDAGASGYVLKRSVASDIVTAIEEAHRGGTFLSPGLARPR